MQYHSRVQTVPQTTSEKIEERINKCGKTGKHIKIKVFFKKKNPQGIE